MSFNFAEAIAQSERETANTALEAIVLGQSGAGKSRLLGSLGVKTLYLYTSGETHGVKSAKASPSSDVQSVAIDYADGKQLTPDQAYDRLLAALADVDGIKAAGFKAVAVDGATELEALIRATSKWRTMCLSNKGSHNSFEEPRATLTMFRPIINALKHLQRQLGIHIALSCILDVQEYGDMHEVVKCAPRLLGFAVAESIVQQFGDVLVVGPMKNDGETKYKLQFMTDVVKTSKTEAGVVKRTVNFAPRIVGLSVQALPPYMDANLSEVVKMKAAGEKAVG